MMRLISCVVLTLIATSATSQNKPAPGGPSARVLYAVPLVLRGDEKQQVVLHGKSLETVKSVKVRGAAGAKVKFLAARKVAVPNNFPGERVGDSEVAIELELPHAVKPGTVTLVAIGPAGDSEPYTLLLRDELAPQIEKEENGSFRAAQPLTLPCAVEARIENPRDVDLFRWSGQKGERIQIEVQAARFGSPVDALVTLYDAERRIVVAADDSGASSDPIVSAVLPRNGIYYVSVIDAHDLGGANFGYRLVVKHVK